MQSIIEEIVYKKLAENLELRGGSVESITADTDLLKSGLIDSMEFVELLCEIEKKTSIPIDQFLNDEIELEISVNWFSKKFKSL